MGVQAIEGRFLVALMSAILANGCGDWWGEPEVDHPPSVPSGLSAEATGPHEVALTWTPSSDDQSVVEYEILLDGLKISSTPATSFTDSGLWISSSAKTAMPPFWAATS